MLVASGAGHASAASWAAAEDAVCGSRVGEGCLSAGGMSRPADKTRHHQGARAAHAPAMYT